jgi:hypothetical protein
MSRVHMLSQHGAKDVAYACGQLQQRRSRQQGNGVHASQDASLPSSFAVRQQNTGRRTAAAPELTSYSGLPLHARSSLGARRKNSSAKRGPWGTSSPRSSFSGRLNVTLVVLPGLGHTHLRAGQ